jgi:DNA-binding NarL/FixJ family response regulator
VSTAAIPRATTGDAQEEPVAGPASSRSTVLLAGFDGVLGVGLRDAIEREAVLRAAVCDDARSLSAVIALQQPAVVLIWCDVLASLIELRRLVLAHPAIAVVVAVARESRKRDDALVSAGAAVLPLTLDADELRVALRLLALRIVGPPRPPADCAARDLARLTVREAQVFESLAQLRSAVEIAAALHVSVTTVNAHRRRIYEKLGIHSRRDLAAFAAGLLGAGASARQRVATVA